MAGGYRAIDSARLEKGCRVWGTDITPDETPYESGLGFCVKLDKEFIGREALESERGKAPRVEAAAAWCSRTRARSRSATSRCAWAATCAGGSPAAATATPSERSIAYARLPTEHAEPGTEVAVEVFGEWVAGEVAAEPLFDPTGERIRA